MKKIIIMSFCLLLTACGSQSSTNTSNSSSISTDASKLTLIEPRKDEGYTEELINYAKNIIENNPTIGEDGKASMNYAGATYALDGKEYAVFLFLNRSPQIVDRSIRFDLSWSYENQVIFEEQKILYNHDSRGDLGINQAALMMIEITPEQKKIIDQMDNPEKMTLDISNFSIVEGEYND